MEGPVIRAVRIVNRRGLHARAAAKFVKLAGEFETELTVAKDGVEVSGHSIMGLMMLAAAPGTTIEVRGCGGQAREAVAAIAALVASGFDEE